MKNLLRNNHESIGDKTMNLLSVKSMTPRPLCYALLLGTLWGSAGCSSTPAPENKLYMLDSAPAVINHPDNAELVAVKNIRTPKYLDQKFLVTQVEPHQYRFARYHQWADNFSDTFKRGIINALNKRAYQKRDKPSNALSSNSNKALGGSEKALGGLNKNISSFHFVGQCSYCLSIQIYVEHFYPTATSDLVFSGYYEIKDKQGDSTHYQRYAFKEPLAADGFSAAVQQMHDMLNTLSDQVLFDINQTM